MKIKILAFAVGFMCTGLQAGAQVKSQTSVNEFDNVVARQFQILHGKINELRKLNLEASPGPILKVSVKDKYYYMDTKFKYLDVIPTSLAADPQYRVCNGVMPPKQGKGIKAVAFPKTTDKRECSDPRELWTAYGKRYNSTLAPENRMEVMDWMATLTTPAQAAQIAEMIAVQLGITKDRAPLYKLDSIVLESLAYGDDVSTYSFDFRVRQKNTGNLINLNRTKTCKALVSVVIGAQGPSIEGPDMSCRTTTEIPHQ